MKVVAVLEVSITGGGAFHQGLNAIRQMRDLARGQFEFEVITQHHENVRFLEEIGVKSRVFRKTWFDKLFFILVDSYMLRRQLFQHKVLSAFEKDLLENGADVVYFLTQSRLPSMLVKIPFITTVFDICHRDFPEFPEVRECGVFFSRDEHFKNNLPAASLVITDSPELSEKIVRKYGVDAERIIAIPYGTADIEAYDETEHVLQQYKITSGYFFYPAQFWPHKNHVRIIEAMALLKASGSDFRVVFAGGDKGNRLYLEKMAKNLGVEGRITFLGFVPQQHMHGLYAGCHAVIMPTYFGPTNLPPLEAWTFNKPLIYSAHLRSHAGDAALYVDADSVDDIATAMQACMDKTTVEHLVRQGHLRRLALADERAMAEQQLAESLRRLNLRRRCWQATDN